jgi:hypothetical protein
MAVGDWNLVHTGYQLWYPNPESFYEPWVWNSTSFYRYNESIVTLAKGPGDSKYHVYLFDQYSISKLVDLSSIYSTYNGFRFDSFVKLGDSLLICGVYFTYIFGVAQAIIAVFKIDGDLNITKTVDSYAGYGVGPHTGPWPAWSPKLGIVRGNLKLIYQVGGAILGGGEVVNFIYTSPSGTNWFKELEDDATSGGGIKGPLSSRNFVVATSGYDGLALFSYQVIPTQYGAGYQFTNGSWSLINKTFTNSSYYQRLFAAYSSGVIHNLSTDNEIYITQDITTDTKFAETIPTSGRTTGFTPWTGTWWISGPDGSGDTDVYYWNYPTNAWVLDADFSTGNAGVGFALVNVDGTLWGLPISGDSHGVYYRDRAGFGFAKKGGRSWKLSIDRGEDQVYASTYTQTANPEFWKVASDLGTVTPIGYSTISGAPGIVHSHYTNHVVIGGVFSDSLLRYSDDAFVTAASDIIAPSGVAYASTIEQLMDNPYLDGNLFVAVVLTDDSGAPMKYTGGELVLMSGNMHFDARESCRNWDQIFIGQQTTGNASIVQYTENMGNSFEIRDTGLPDLTITDMEFS